MCIPAIVPVQHGSCTGLR